MPAIVIENLAKKIENDLNERVSKEDTYGIDPITILMLISICLTLIRVIQECRKNRISEFGDAGEVADYITTEARFLCFNHSWLTRRRIKKAIQSQLTNEQYKVYGDALLKSVLEVGKNLTEEETVALLEYKHV